MNNNILIGNVVDETEVIAIGAQQNDHYRNIIIGYHSDISGHNSNNNVNIGAHNIIEGNNNMVIGHNNTIKGSNNIIFSSNQKITGDNYYIVALNTNTEFNNCKNIDIMFDNILLYKLLLFKNYGEREIIPNDIIRYIVRYIYDIRLSRGEAMGYCVNTIKQALTNINYI